MTLRAAPAWMTITLTLWVTTSCSSRAIRARSCSAARRSASACSRSSVDSRARPSSARRFHRRSPSAATAIGIRIRNGTASSGTVGHRRLPELGVQQRRDRQAGQRRHPVRAVDGGGVGGDDAGVEREPQRGVDVARPAGAVREHDPQHRERVPAAQHQRQHHQRRTCSDRPAGLIVLDRQERIGHRRDAPGPAAAAVRVDRRRICRSTARASPSPSAGDRREQPRPSASITSKIWPRRDSGGSGPDGRSSSRDPVPQPAGHRHVRHQAILADAVRPAASARLTTGATSRDYIAGMTPAGLIPARYRRCLRRPTRRPGPRT